MARCAPSISAPGRAGGVRRSSSPAEGGTRTSTRRSYGRPATLRACDTRPRSFWLDEAGGVDQPAPPLAGDVRADVVVLGGGYTGLWTAWWARVLAPDARVVLLEADLCGHGPSGRNGGFCEDLWLSLPALRARFGDERALALCRASEAAVDGIAAFCAQEGVDAHVRRRGPARREHRAGPGRGRRRGRRGGARARVPEKVVALTGDEARARFGSPLVREGVLLPTGASVQPARLALGLRARLRERGVAVHEHTPVRRVLARPGAVEVHTPGGRVVAAHAVLATGSALAGGPLRGRLAVGSSHVVLTEPVPDVLARAGWTGGETVSDGRTLLHYLRTTADGRIAFGWAGGRPAFGARLGGRVEADRRSPRPRASTWTACCRGCAAGRSCGPGAGRSTSPPPPAAVTTLGPRAHAAAGYTGNGVGPSHLVGRALAALALGADDPARGCPSSTRPPPGACRPSAAVGRRERGDRGGQARRGRQERGRRPDPVSAAVAGLPARLGMTVAR
jgi:glycine/D-amino acid oxidase-like deaminating enzyme